MDFPKRIKQHKNESDSFAIVHYKLRDLGIFRNMTESDYGIDFEIEVVNGSYVQGKTIKVQLKSSEDLNVRQSDGMATVGGIKQSTFCYWASLSHDVPVIGLAVDLPTEDIYCSDPLFFQSIVNIKSANDNSTRSILFKPFHKTDTIPYLRMVANGYNLRGALYSLRWLMRNFRKIMDYYYNAMGCDFFMEIDDIDLLKTILENSYEILIFSSISGFVDKESFKPEFFEFTHYANENDGLTPTYKNVVDGFKVMLPVLVKMLRIIKNIMENSAYYWLYEDFDLLNIVERTFIPNPQEVITDKYGNTDDYWPQDYDGNDYGPLSYVMEKNGINDQEVLSVLFKRISNVSFSNWKPIEDK